MLEAELERTGGIDALADAVRTGETDPYSIADAVLEDLEACLAEADLEGDLDSEDRSEHEGNLGETTLEGDEPSR